MCEKSSGEIDEEIKVDLVGGYLLIWLFVYLVI
jgi:hypothetical protein